MEEHPHFTTHLINPLDVVGQFNAINGDPPFLMDLQAIDAADQGRFSRPRRSADHQFFPFADPEIDLF